MECTGCVRAHWTIHPGCGRHGTSGPAANRPGLRCPTVMRSLRNNPPHEAKALVLGQRLEPVMRVGALGIVGMVLLAATPAGAVDWAKAQTVTMVATDYQ